MRTHSSSCPGWDPEPAIASITNAIKGAVAAGKKITVDHEAGIRKFIGEDGFLRQEPDASETITIRIEALSQSDMLNALANRVRSLEEILASLESRDGHLSLKNTEK